MASRRSPLSFVNDGCLDRVSTRMVAEAYDGKVPEVGDEVESLLRTLRLSKAETDGVVLANEERNKLPEVKWLAVARLLTSKQISEQSLFSTMRTTWNTTREVSFCVIG